MPRKAIQKRMDKSGRIFLTTKEKDNIKLHFKKYFDNLELKLNTEIVMTIMEEEKEKFKSLEKDLSDFGRIKYSKIFEYIRVTRKNKKKRN